MSDTETPAATEETDVVQISEETAVPDEAAAVEAVVEQEETPKDAAEETPEDAAEETPKEEPKPAAPARVPVTAPVTIDPTSAACIAELDEELADEIDTPKVLAEDLLESTSEDSLKEYFSKFGEVRVVKLKKTSEGKSKGFCFIIFSDPANINKALEETEHEIDGQAVKLTKAMPSSDKMKTNKLFIGGLSSALSEEQLQEYFEKYGKIQNFQFIVNKATNVRKAFCFVVFESADAVEKITEGKVPPNSVVHTIEGHTVDCKKKFDEDHPVQRKIKARSQQSYHNRQQYQNYGSAYQQGQYDAAAAAYAGYGAYGYSGYEGYYAGYGGYGYPGYGYPAYPAAYGYPGYGYPQPYGSAYGPVKPNRNTGYKPY